MPHLTVCAQCNGLSEGACPTCPTPRKDIRSTEAKARRAAHPRQRVYNSTAWRALSKAAKARDDYTCQSCGHHDSSGRTLSVDHLDALADGGLAIPPLSDVETLCTTCHGRREAARQAQRAQR